ncbi:uncharacterized protein LOC114535791 [Dendronephthya gigantea]|uniref:uncharacterized protein LOC114535791 n=1 Tax=Dendronephthya gigantea TaxID=151771 RepID=UPI00106BBCCF|nr:uncharacterized protein LOC114535791 [Dendronephthya gigantea]
MGSAFEISLIFWIALYFSLTTCINGDSYVCKKVKCGCEFSTKNGTYKISMDKISKKGTYFKEIRNGYWTYFVDPCYGFTMNTICTGVRLCQFADGQSFPIAKDIKSYGDYNEDQRSLTVKYAPVTFQGATRHLELILVYDSATSVTVYQSSDFDYKVAIKSPSIVPQKVHPGSNQDKSSSLRTGSIPFEV